MGVGVGGGDVGDGEEEAAGASVGVSGEMNGCTLTVRMATSFCASSSDEVVVRETVTVICPRGGG